MENARFILAYSPETSPISTLYPATLGLPQDNGFLDQPVSSVRQRFHGNTECSPTNTSVPFPMFPLEVAGPANL